MQRRGQYARCAATRICVGVRCSASVSMLMRMPVSVLMHMSVSALMHMSVCLCCMAVCLNMQVQYGNHVFVCVCALRERAEWCSHKVFRWIPMLGSTHTPFLRVLQYSNQHSSLKICSCPQNNLQDPILRSPRPVLNVMTIFVITEGFVDHVCFLFERANIPSLLTLRLAPKHADLW